MVISQSDLHSWGCPSCGYRSGSMPIRQGGAGVWQCGECGASCIVLADGLDSVPESWVIATERARVPHPRAGTPAHGRPDKRPDGGGEFFWSRGVGVEYGLKCFVCGSDDQRQNVAAFVQCKEAGERIVAMFGRGAKLAFRSSEPDRVQVKIGACVRHVWALEKLHGDTSRAGIVTAEIIAAIQGAA